MSTRPSAGRASTPPRPLLEHLDQALLVAKRPRLGLVVDFDGTISEIASTPDAAVISPACRHALATLSGKLAVVSIASGRSVDDLRGKVGLDGVVYSGHHGAEYLDRGRRHVVPEAARLRPTVKAAFEYLKSKVDVAGLVWQDKGLSASVHFRLASDARHTRRVLEDALARAPGIEELEVFWAKKILELRPPGIHKGYAVARLVSERGLDGMIAIGDDITDVDALVAVKEIAADGTVLGLGVAVSYDDSPVELFGAADYTLNGVPEVEAFLSWLGETVDGERSEVVAGPG